jgi:hypothetical protein
MSKHNLQPQIDLDFQKNNMLTPENSLDQVLRRPPVHAIIHDPEGGDTHINDNDELVVLGISREVIKPKIQSTIKTGSENTSVK